VTHHLCCLLCHLSQASLHKHCHSSQSGEPSWLTSKSVRQPSALPSKSIRQALSIAICCAVKDKQAIRCAREINCILVSPPCALCGGVSPQFWTLHCDISVVKTIVESRLVGSPLGPRGGLVQIYTCHLVGWGICSQLILCCVLTSFNYM
jgi:hypothetical protein